MDSTNTFGFIELSRRTPLGLKLDASSCYKLDPQLRPLLCALAVSSRVLCLSMETQFTAACLLNRYYCRQLQQAQGNSCDDKRADVVVVVKEEERMGILGACLFLGAKVSEESRRLRDIINCMQMISISWSDEVKKAGAASKKSSMVEQQHDAFHLHQQATAKVHLTWNSRPPLLDEAYWDSKKKIIELEQHVLRWIGFDTFVNSPHRAVVIVVERIVMDQQQQLPGSGKTTMTQLQPIILKAWKLVNDSIFSIWCLQQTVMSLACAAVDLACHGHLAVPFTAFEVTQEEFLNAKTALEHVMRQLLVDAPR